MGFYGEQVVPRIINVACATRVHKSLRQRVCEGLVGDIVEIGFGSGLNVPFYPATVTRIDAVEPSDVGWKLAGKRLEVTGVPVRRCGLDGQSLPLEDDSYDAALSTWTLCTIPDVAAALREVGRVLKPGGPYILSSTDWLPTRRCAAGSDASTRWRSGSPADATSPGQSSTC